MGAFPLPSVQAPLLGSRDSLALYAFEYAALTAATASKEVDPITWRGALRSVAEAALKLPLIEKPGDKGSGIYVERTLLDAFLPFNATISLTLAFVTASANELTRSNKINDLVTYIAGPEEDDGSGNKPEPSLPWEWDRVGHDTCANLFKDTGAQTLTRYVEKRAKAKLGDGQAYCELLKHAHKAACKEFHECKAVPGSRALVASSKASQIVLASPTFYVVRALTGWFADVAVDAIACIRGQISSSQLFSNGWLKLVKYSLGGALCVGFGALVPFVYPHPYIFIGIEQLAANLIADSVVESYLGNVVPS